ncbi:hypothetical protein GCM10011581_12320 [Saccharopolyspora subtropica]|uniref:Uncharacterized protein n=1 Tax=Saccharopolyspora thermophila TaxID=89367 RepID=A0A917JQG2_9PSEU|nr:DUF6247 family protein [Saccharopolyspora subtropica]GGI76735.1 hypothetical protein GCM10011581_12320 [Saccharopolyspora subtropica]
MAAPYPASSTNPVPPPADAATIRACLTPRVAAEFDAEWELALDRAKSSHDLTEVFELLHKWRHLAHAEQLSPGTYFSLLAKTEQITSTGQNPAAASLEDMQALIRRRLGR